MVKKYIFLFCFCPFLAHSSQFSKFLDVLGQVESSNNPKAYNKKEKALGIYQIRPQYFKDAQDFNPKLKNYTHKDCFNPLISAWVVKSYMRRWEPKALKENDFETLARLHNGGCGFRNKTGQAKINLDKYWERFILVKNNLKF